MSDNCHGPRVFISFTRNYWLFSLYSMKLGLKWPLAALSPSALPLPPPVVAAATPPDLVGNDVDLGKGSVAANLSRRRRHHHLALPPTATPSDSFWNGADLASCRRRRCPDQLP
uniref:Uncharacterized protein n=1 Tax=Oryza sativa subsp. japonica TaxID=39947 RepID=Q6H762_ORYSJ|nr:hypothetical protein [Oryza sativa Japonica Group]